MLIQRKRKTVQIDKCNEEQNSQILLLFLCIRGY